MRKRALTVLLVTIAVLGMTAAAVYASTGTHHRHHDHGRLAFPPSIQRFDLSGYTIQTSYTLGRNKGSTFEQTYTGSTVQGVPTAGPFVGQTFPPQDYVALPVGHKMLYVAWLDPTTHAIVDAFVMNFKTGVVWDYAPDPQNPPESSGTVKILVKGTNRIP
jgi:hypothetical protein